MLLQSTGRECLQLIREEIPDVSKHIKLLTDVMARGASVDLLTKILAYRYSRVDPAFSALNLLLSLRVNVSQSTDLNADNCVHLAQLATEEAHTVVKSESDINLNLLGSYAAEMLSRSRARRQKLPLNIVTYLNLFYVSGLLEGLCLGNKIDRARFSDYREKPSRIVFTLVYNDTLRDPRVQKCLIEYSKRGFLNIVVGYQVKEDLMRCEHRSEPAVERFIVRNIKRFASGALGLIKNSEVQFRASQMYLGGIVVGVAENLKKLLADEVVIHTHDMHVLLCGKIINDALTANAKIRTAWIHDYHELVTGLEFKNKGRRDLFVSDERILSQKPDVNVTVSDGLSASLRSLYGIKSIIVYNSLLSECRDKQRRYQPIKDRLGLAHDQHLIIYSGSVVEQRRVHLPLTALAAEPTVNYAIVTSDSPSNNDYLATLLSRAKSLGVRSRVHLIPYVEPEYAWELMCGATAVLSMLPRYANGDIALPNKLFDGLKAGVAILSSDTTEMAKFLQEQNCGVVFAADDEGDFLRALRLLLHTKLSVDAESFQSFAWDIRFQEVLAAADAFIEQQPRELPSRTANVDATYEVSGSAIGISYRD